MVHARVFCHSSHKIHFSSCNSAFVSVAFIVQHSLTYVDKARDYKFLFLCSVSDSAACLPLLYMIIFECSKCYIDQKFLSNFKKFSCVTWMTCVELKHKRHHVPSLKPLIRLKEIWYYFPTVETVMNWSLQTVTPILLNPGRLQLLGCDAMANGSVWWNPLPPYSTLKWK